MKRKEKVCPARSIKLVRVVGQADKGHRFVLKTAIEYSSGARFVLFRVAFERLNSNAGGGWIEPNLRFPLLLLLITIHHLTHHHHHHHHLTLSLSLSVSLEHSLRRVQAALPGYPRTLSLTRPTTHDPRPQSSQQSDRHTLVRQRSFDPPNSPLSDPPPPYQIQASVTLLTASDHQLEPSGSLRSAAPKLDPPRRDPALRQNPFPPSLSRGAKRAKARAGATARKRASIRSATHATSLARSCALDHGHSISWGAADLRQIGSVRRCRIIRCVYATCDVRCTNGRCSAPYWCDSGKAGGKDERTRKGSLCFWALECYAPAFKIWESIWDWAAPELGGTSSELSQRDVRSGNGCYMRVQTAVMEADLQAAPRNSLTSSTSGSIIQMDGSLGYGEHTLYPA